MIGVLLRLVSYKTLESSRPLFALQRVLHALRRRLAEITAVWDIRRTLGPFLSIAPRQAVKAGYARAF